MHEPSRHFELFCVDWPINHPVITFKGSGCDKRKSQPPFDAHRQYL